MTRAPAVRSYAIFLTTWLWAAACFAQPVTQTAMVEMADGVKLATDVTLPDPATGESYPTILIRTPYGKSQGKGLINTFCPKGYAVVAQDMRGRFASEGRPVPIFANEGLGQHRDGHETLSWIAKQKWSNGKVAMWGGSASACVQNMAAPGAPDALKGLFVMEAFSDYYQQFAYQGGVFRKSIFEGWLKTQKMDEGNLDLFLAHPYDDEFWKGLNFERHADKVNAPAIFLGGWYDVFAQGTINGFVAVQNHGGPAARGHCYLVMGPITHGLFHQGHEKNYPNAARPPIQPFMPVEFYDYWLKGENEDKIAAIKPVNYYVMGAMSEPGAPGNYWRSADTWPPPAQATPFYLHADKSLRRGSAPDSNDSLTYKYDPEKPVPTLGGQELFPPAGPTDQSKAESRDDVLVFTTDELKEPIEVTGRITAKLYISSDCPDTDFTVKLCDVYPDGRSILVTDGIRRASLRNGFEKPEPLEPGKTYEVGVDLWSTSLIVNKGHKIRVDVSSSNAPRFEPNPNTGDPHPVPGKSRIATNTIHLSKEHPSHILLPIYTGTSSNPTNPSPP